MISHTEAEKGGDARFIVARPVRLRAIELQRQGLTMTEIAEALGYQRRSIVQVLYTDAVRP